MGRSWRRCLADAHDVVTRDDALAAEVRHGQHVSAGDQCVLRSSREGDETEGRDIHRQLEPVTAAVVDRPFDVIDQGKRADVRTDAGLTLVALGAQAIEPMMSVLAERGLSTHACVSVINVLSQIAGPEVLEALKPYVRHPRSAIRSATIGAFQALDPANSVSILLAALDDTEQSAVAWLILFASDDSVDLPPQVLIEGPSWTELLSGLIVMRGFAMDDDHAPPTVQWALTDDASVSMACMQPRIDPPETFTWNNATSNWLDGAFQIPVDTTQYDDGAYVLVVRAVAEDGSTSPSACVPVGLDNHPPEAHITGPTLIEESEAMLSFDGSGSSDAFWGREELVFLWILEEIGGAPEDRLIQSGRDLRTLDVSASEAGAYSLTLTVADSGGFSDTTTHLFDITNRAPSAALRIDGQPLVDGDLITLAEDNQWWLDCGGSTDTPNDEPGLTCTWFIDGEPVMTGWERQLMRPEDVSTTHTLILLVEDDDGGICGDTSYFWFCIWIFTTLSRCRSRRTLYSKRP